jgi:hypothetical protein
MSKALFILKTRDPYGSDYDMEMDFSYSYSQPAEASSGMSIACQLIADMLVENGREAVVVTISYPEDLYQILSSTSGVTDMIIEGLWLDPDYMAGLMTSFPTVRWSVHIHSEIPFLATEGIAMNFVVRYLTNGAWIITNSARAHERLSWLARSAAGIPNSNRSHTVYLPNVYTKTFLPHVTTPVAAGELHIGSFGALRVLKNQLQQAFIALKIAENMGLKLVFHINEKPEGQGGAIEQNLDALFASLPHHELVKHPWVSHDNFLLELQGVDMVMQLSMSETFNIVAADATLVGKPVLASGEIEWLYPIYGDPHDVDQAVLAATTLLEIPGLAVQGSRQGLLAYIAGAARRWLNYLPISA